jgi:flagellar hook-associated protein 2
MTTIDPSTLATQLATAYTQPFQAQLQTQQSNAQATATALSKLRSALQDFDSALLSLSSKNGMTASSATLSAAIGTATASASAQAGSYPVSVQQLASAHQITLTFPAAVPVFTGSPLTVHLDDGHSFTISDLNQWDADTDGQLTATEVARAINTASGNNGLVSAGVVSANGQSQLVLTAGSTGAGSRITLDVSGMPAGTLQDTLGAVPTQLAPAQDAIATLAGMSITQSSNTFTAISGVSLTFTQANTSATLVVGSDTGGTAANVQGFVSAYNTLKKALDTLTDAGEPGGASKAGPFVTDAGVRALRDRLNTLFRQSVNGVSLVDYGVSADREGNLKLDQTRLASKLATNPTGLDDLFGSTSVTAPTGVLGSLDKLMGSWLNSATGYIAKRQNSVQNIQRSLNERQTRLQTQYASAYDRYLRQFSALQSLQTQMSQTSDMFIQMRAQS